MWKRKDRRSTQAFVVTDNTIYGADNSGLTAASTEFGAIKWRISADRSCPLVVAGKTLYTGGDGFTAYALNGGIGAKGYRSGVKHWRYDAGSVLYGLAIGDGAFFGIAAQIGIEIARTPTPMHWKR